MTKGGDAHPNTVWPGPAGHPEQSMNNVEFGEMSITLSWLKQRGHSAVGVRGQAQAIGWLIGSTGVGITGCGAVAAV